MGKSLNLLGELGSDSTFKVNTVYFFGAGASANAIPVMKNLRPRIIQLKDLIGNIYSSIKSHQGYHSESLKQNIKALGWIYEDFKWLIDESKYFSSLDTLAKKYYLIDNADSYNLIRLKKTLCVYFFFEQWVEFGETNEVENDYKIFDLRYDSLISELLENKNGVVRFKEGVKFVTWNYDLQFEKTLLKYTQTNNFNRLKKDFFIIPNKTTIDNIDRALTYENVSSLIKLNGNAFLDFKLEEKDNTLTLYDFKSEFDSFNEALEFFLEKYLKIFPSERSSHKSLKYFNYSWEVNDKQKFAYETINRTVEEAKNSFSSARTIIIIGYSFPYVNREVDKEILSFCMPSKLIIQDKQPEIILSRLINIVSRRTRDKIKSKQIEVILEKDSNYFPSIE